MRFTAITASLTTLMLIAACDDSEDATPVDDDGGSDAPGQSTGDDGSAADASPEDAAPPARICSVDDWCHTTVPPGQTLVDVWADGHAVAWAVSEEGAILRWNGTEWKVHFESEGALTTIWGSSPTDLWAGGARGLLHGDGTTWSTVDLGEEGVVIEDVAGTSTSGVWAVGEVFVASDAGPKEPPKGPSPPGPGPSPEVVPKPRIFHRVDPAAGFVRDRLADVASHADYEKLGRAWRVWIAGSSDVWLIASEMSTGGMGPFSAADLLLRRRASSWSFEPPPSELRSGLSSTAFTGAGAVGSDSWLFGGLAFVGSTCWQSAPADDGWQMNAWKTSKNVYGHGVFGVSSSDVWVSGMAGQIRHWDGSAWTSARVIVDGDPVGDDLRAISGVTNDDIWVVGGHRALHKVSSAEAARLNDAYARRDGGP